MEEREQSETIYTQQKQDPDQMVQEKISKQSNSSYNEEEKQIIETKQNLFEDTMKGFEDEWLKFTSDPQDGLCGTFHVNKYLLDEQSEASKSLYSCKKTLHQNKQKQKPTLSKYDPNFLWIDQNNRKAHTYWSFIPNKVTRPLFL